MPYEEPPGCITCPITGTLFVHPVLLPDGWTYEMECVTSPVKTTNRLMLDLVQFWSRTKSMPAINDWEGYVCPTTKDRTQQHTVTPQCHQMSKLSEAR